MKKIILSKKTKVYIFAPAKIFTGGPELLHQLAYTITKKYKIDVKMVYLPITDTNPIHNNFEKYKIKFSNYIEDEKKNILIIPEHYQFLSYSLKFKKIRKILWWLSLDNYFGYKFRYEFSKTIRSIIKIPYNLIKIFNKLINYRFGIFTYQDFLKLFYKNFNLCNFKELSQIDYHFSQSSYAQNYLKKYFKDIKILSDFQRPEILNNYKKKLKKKKNLICYSNKSNLFIKQIKKHTNYKMIELAGFSNSQLINIFKKTKVYLDFGYHPGKDRMPREAVLFNNCVITNIKGSAKNNIDIPINRKYKFKESIVNLKNINLRISKIFKNYKTEIKNFKKYQNIVLKEKKKFYGDLDKIFIKM